VPQRARRSASGFAAARRGDRAPAGACSPPEVAARSRGGARRRPADLELAAAVVLGAPALRSASSRWCSTAVRTFDPGALAAVALSSSPPTTELAADLEEHAREVVLARAAEPPVVLAGVAGRSPPPLALGRSATLGRSVRHTAKAGPNRSTLGCDEFAAMRTRTCPMAPRRGRNCIVLSWMVFGTIRSAKLTRDG